MIKQFKQYYKTLYLCGSALLYYNLLIYIVQYMKYKCYAINLDNLIIFLL